MNADGKNQAKDMIDDQDTVMLGDHIEILSTDDERLSIIGEELSNETGRAILNKLFEGVGTVSEISTSLEISIPLVRWHIQRLSKANLIKIDHTKLSSKNKSIHQYKPTKFAFVIVPSKVVSSEVYSNLLKTSLKKIYQFLPSIIVFTAGTIAMYLIEMQDQISGFSFTSKTYYINSPIESDTILPFIVGGIGALAAWIAVRLYKKKMKRLT